MPRKLTERQRRFVAIMGEDKQVDARVAAERAGYKDPTTSAGELLDNASVARAIVVRTMGRAAQLLPLAFDTLEDVMRHGKGAPRVLAAKVIMDRALGALEDKGGKEPHEMSAEELEERLRKIRSEAADRARPVMDLTPGTGDLAGVTLDEDD